jgi:hypothetical protein
MKHPWPLGNLKKHAPKQIKSIKAWRSSKVSKSKAPKATKVAQRIRSYRP